MQKHKQENAPREYTRDAPSYFAFALEKLAVFPESSVRGIAYTALPIPRQVYSLRQRAGGESCSTPHHPMRVNLPIIFCTIIGMSKITFQKIIFPENKANNSTYRHQKQLKCWQWRNTAVARRRTLPFPAFLPSASAIVQSPKS